MHREKNDILILGAGISGLIAGRQLVRAGFHVGLVEARSTTGGRIRSVHEHGVIVEAGPEFIHGRLRETISLLREYGIPFAPTRGSMYYGEAGRFTREEEAVDHWDLLLEKMKNLKDDMPFLSFLLRYFGGDAFAKLRDSAIRFASGFDLADVRTASTRSLIREWQEDEEEQFRIPGGYGQLSAALTAEILKAGGEIFVSERVLEVKWKQNSVHVVSTGGMHTARNLLVTLPAGILTQYGEGKYAVAFSPEMEMKRKALSDIGFGSVIKIILYWKNAFWKRHLPDLQFIFSTQEIPTWWTQSTVDIPVLVGWLGGPAADERVLLSDEEIRDIALRNLASLFDMAVPALSEELLDCKVFNWRKDPYTLGAYSFELAGLDQAKSIWKKSVEKTIYFAGEACYEGPHGGTVEAAIVSGLEAAREITLFSGRTAQPGQPGWNVDNNPEK